MPFVMPPYASFWLGLTGGTRALSLSGSRAVVQYASISGFMAVRSARETSVCERSSYAQRVRSEERPPLCWPPTYGNVLWFLLVLNILPTSDFYTVI